MMGGAVAAGTDTKTGIPGTTWGAGGGVVKLDAPEWKTSRTSPPTNPGVGKPLSTKDLVNEDTDGGSGSGCCKDLSGATDSTSEDATDAGACRTIEGGAGRLR
jgi:hypothetical protein